MSRSHPEGERTVIPDPTADTLPKLLLANTARFGTRTALREKEFGIWQPCSWAAFGGRVADFASGLRTLGVQREDRVAIIGDNRPEWVIAELAAHALGAISVGIYQDAVASEVCHVLEASDARVVVAEDQEQVDKILEIRAQLPGLTHIVYDDPRGMRGYDDPTLHPFPTIEARGREANRADPTAFAEAVHTTHADDVAVLCTTSGTTAKPKLAMLTHANLLSMARQLQTVDPLTPNDEHVSMLPLAWIGEQMVTVSSSLIVGFTVNYPEETSTLREDLREIGPHVMFSPPRIWENMLSTVQVRMEDAPPLKRRVFGWALGVGEAAADARFGTDPVAPVSRWKRTLAEWVGLRPVKDQLGLRHLRYAYTGGAALGPDVFRFFHALGINLKQIYGQTEVSGISVLHRDDDIKFQTVGRPLPGTEVRIDEGGEIITRSPAVFAGYYRDPDATARALVDGWLRSGDAGYLDGDGHLVVIDRAQDVMTLSDGTTFSPQFIENKLKFSPYVREAVVFGGEYPFVAALITIDFDNAGKWAERRQIPYTTFTDLSQKDEIYALVRGHVEHCNPDLPVAARIQRFLLLHKELDADDAELTRTRKVRRGVIASRYEHLIAALYQEQTVVSVEVPITYQDGRSSSVRTDLRIESVT